MEFSFNINELLPDIITVVNHKLAPFRCRGKTDRYEFATNQSQLKMIIDKMGEASTRAQGLKTPITSAMKLQHSDHSLYIMKDSSANHGLGAVVGILKVGHKKLFLLDIQSVQNEVHPLCVLDFYVHESRQRTGCGRQMFEHVLKVENKMANQLAIDRPSHKFVAFLKKYYGFKNVIPQANNFVIHDLFFADPEAIGLVPCRGQRFVDDSRSGRPPHHPYKSTSKGQNYSETGGLHPGPSSVRSSYRPTSGQSISHLSSNTTETYKKNDYSSTFMMNDSLRDLNLPPLGPRPPSRNSMPGSRESSLGMTSMAGRRKRGSYDQIQPEIYNASRGMAARASSFSRHSARSGSADLVRWSKDTGAGDDRDHNNIIRSNSGGRMRSLHLTSIENPFMRREQKKVVPMASSDLQTLQQDNSSNITAQQRETVSKDFSSSENYSVNALFNERFEVRPPFLGSSWNIFGVPSYMNKDSRSPHYMYTKRTQQRHHPF